MALQCAATMFMNIVMIALNHEKKQTNKKTFVSWCDTGLYN